ncbi:MAG: hypothetical protein GEEBNDBF_01534 [bacterium]|nr:hypothetical protein [bacterium]
MSETETHTATCPLCAQVQDLSQELRLAWVTADWKAGQDASQHEPHEAWVPVCEECATRATTFRVTYPVELRQHEQGALRLVITFGITLALLIAILISGRGLVNSDPLTVKLLFAAGWFAFGIGLILTLLQFSKFLAFELGGRHPWSGPWLEKRFAQLLALPTGDQAPYWWQIRLLESLQVRTRPLPTPPVTSIDPLAPVTISIFPTLGTDPTP